MQSFIIASKNKVERENAAVKICQDNGVAHFDIVILENEGSVGIADIRNFGKNIFLKPLYGITKAAIIHNAHDLTPAAQNALLKTIEEPPPHTLFILTTESKEALLPTIQSRCSIIELTSTTGEPKVNSAPPIAALLSLDISETLVLTQKETATRPDALLWLEDAIVAIRESLQNEVSQPTISSCVTIKQYRMLLQSLQATYTIIKTTNVNPRFALEICFLQLRQ